jgi:hypothetical protein
MMRDPFPRLLLEPIKRLTIRVVDVAVLARYRKKGLVKYQLLTIEPDEITQGYGPEGAPAAFLGVVNARYWGHPRTSVALARNGTIGNCIARVHRDESWERVGEKKRLRQAWKNLGSPGNFELWWEHKRAGYDALLDDVRADGFLKPRSTLEGGRNFRERGGIGILIGPGGEIAICSGHHRLGIALGLKLPSIPVCLVGVHPSFVKTGWSNFFTAHR